MKVAVLEARPRVGGRTLDHPIGAWNVVEGGGQWVGPGHTRLLALARELGVETFPSYYTGKVALSSWVCAFSEKKMRTTRRT